MEPRLPAGLRSAPYDFILGPRLRQWLSGWCSSHRQANHTSHFQLILHWTKPATWPSAIPMGQKVFSAHSGGPTKSQLQGRDNSRICLSFPLLKKGAEPVPPRPIPVLPFYNSHISQALTQFAYFWPLAQSLVPRGESINVCRMTETLPVWKHRMPKRWDLCWEFSKKTQVQHLP